MNMSEVNNHIASPARMRRHLSARRRGVYSRPIHRNNQFKNWTIQNLGADMPEIMKVILPLLLCLCCSAPVGAHRSSAATQPRKPNVVIILADDMGWGDPECYNAQSKTPTPNIDRLAAQGMRFTDAHSPSGVCTPTRYGLLTGRYAWRTSLKRGVLQGYDPLLVETGRMTIASLLKQNGYNSGAVGKWHLGVGKEKPVDYAKPLAPGPNALGFDYFFGIPSSLDFTPYVYVENERVTELPSATVADSKHQREGGKGFWRGGQAAPSFKHEETLQALTDKATAFLQKQTKDKPFFLYFPLTAPHTPWLPVNEK